MALIEASFDTLLSQGADTASYYLGRAAKAVDDRFGEGYALANPTLVAAYMQLASNDFLNASRMKVDEHIAEMRDHQLLQLGCDIKEGLEFISNALMEKE